MRGLFNPVVVGRREWTALVSIRLADAWPFQQRGGETT